MSALSCSQVQDLTPELALGVLTGAERAEAVAHINDCSPCRNLLGDLSGAADLLTLLVPEAEPPPGFEERVLGSLDRGRQRRRERLRRAAVVAGAVAAASIVTLVLVRVVDHAREPTHPPASAAYHAPMIGAADRVVGQVFVTAGERPSAYVFVEYGRMAPGTYALEIRDLGGKARRVGEMQVRDGRGFWADAITEPEAGDTLALVAPDGTIVCEGALT